MSLKFYADVHVPGPVTSGLIRRGVDVLTSFADETTEEPDEVLFDRASSLGRIFVTQDEDLLALAAARQRAGEEFLGLIYTHQKGISVEKFISDLELVAKAMTMEELRNRVFYLPL